MVETRIVNIDAPDGQGFDGLLLVSDAPNGAGILLLPEIFGVNEFVRNKAADLAGLGYTVLCPDVFWRVERNVAFDHDEASMQRAFEIVGKFGALDADVTLGDLRAALEHLDGLAEVTGKVAVLGYCLGGSLAYSLAAQADPDAAVSYYGSSVPGSLDLAPLVTCPILFHFGGDDPYIPLDGVGEVTKAFGAHDDAMVHVHSGAGHAFENTLAEQFHNADAAAASWPLTVEFLERTLDTTG